MLGYFSRYRDDCTTLNVGNFMDISAEIYPPSLSLTQENDNSEEVDVLDMHVRIQDGQIITKVYCKTDDFPFSVISLPFLVSNLDSKVCYMVFYGQVIRYQRLTSLKGDFEVRTKFLADILLARGYNKKILCNKFSKAVEKYILEFQKWEIPLDIKSWFNNIVG